MAQLKKFGIFDAITQYLKQATGFSYGDFAPAFKPADNITGGFIHRGEKKRRAYRDGRERGWSK